MKIRFVLLAVALLLAFDMGMIAGGVLSRDIWLFLLEDVFFLLLLAGLAAAWLRYRGHLESFVSWLLALRPSVSYDRLTPYTRGLIRGHWTAEEVKEAGWDSATACLANCEENYKHAVSQYHLYDQANIDMREGLITAQRETLLAIIKQTEG